jgi:hypothetical protein
MRTEYAPTKIVHVLGRLSERAKARFLLACIRHAWTTHVSYGTGAHAEDDALRLIDDLLEARDRSLADLTSQLQAFEDFHNRVRSEAQANVPGALVALNVIHVTGALLLWLYYAHEAWSAQPTLTWFAYVTSTRQSLPFWLVLDTSALVGRPGEHAWQAETMWRFCGEPPPEPDVRSPSWIARQAELGPIFMRLWLSPWPDKRVLIEQYPDLTDRTRHLFAKYLIVKSPNQADDDTHQRFLALIDANAILLDWCDAALGDAHAFGGHATAALDGVFGNAALQHIVEKHRP